MKTKKLFLPIIILIIAIAVMAVFAVISNIAKVPAISEGDFPFSITYEFNGETVTIDDVYSARFAGNGGYVDTTVRRYEGSSAILGNDGGTTYLLREDETGSIYLDTKLHADYLLGDPQSDYFAYEAFAPTFFYYDTEYNEFTDEETLSDLGVKLLDWEYPAPIENKLVFSHISGITSEVVIPLALIALIALLAILIFVKKEKDLKKNALYVFSVLFNFVIALFLVPFSTIYGVLSDIAGSGEGIIYLLGYLTPAITILCLAASVALRRKGFGKSGFAIQFIGPAAFLIMVACIFLG